ncbi:MAG: DNA polymerase III subunit gamma/tau, partial [Campylobacterota bacterium]|nr:DNA polymerase III subunit gamma/tau [Campylobacterota bacterium]
TILSRTQHFRFKRIPTSIITEHLKHILGLESISAEDDALNILARSGNGSLRDTLTMLDQAIIYSKNSIDTKTVTDMLGLVDPRFIENIFSAIFSKNRELVVEYIKELDDYEAELVIDEIIAFLKERLYEQNPQYSTLIIERFFGILSSSKSLFALNANNSFVLSITFFKMLEATKIKDVQQLISQLEDELNETITHSVEMQKQEQEQKPIEPLHVEEVEVKKEPEPLHAKYPQGVEPKKDARFEKLTDAIKDRSVEYGECFEKYIEFVSFEDDVLTWESCVDEECKTKLRHGFGVIKQFVKEIYGYDTKIKSTPCTKEEKKKPEQALHVEPIKDESFQQSISTTEDVMTDSCVMGCVDNEPVKELDGRTILEDENVKKMIETFEAKKVTVLSKI